MGFWLLMLGKAIYIISMWGALLATAQVVILCLTIIPVENALKRTFDRFGHRK